MAFSFMNNSFLSIDIGFRLIKILQIKKKDDNLIEIVNFGIGNTPKDCIKNGAIKDKAKVIDEIRRVMQENNLNAKEAKIVMSGTNIITRIIMLDNVSESEISDMVYEEIESFMPINLDEHSIDFKVLEHINKGGKDMIRVFVTAVNKAIIDSYVDILKALNLKPISVDTPANSISKLFNKDITIKQQTNNNASLTRKKDYSLDSGTIAVLDFGSETTIVNIIKNKVLEFNRVILIGSTNIDKSIYDRIIVDKTKIDLAEKYKKQYGIVSKRDINNDMEWNCSEAAKVVVNDIVRNINTCFDFYIARCGGEKISKILITGGGSQLAGLREYLEEVFKLPCFTINSLEIAGVEFYKNLDNTRINYLGNAIGIAL